MHYGGAMGIRDAWIEKRAAAMNGGTRNFSQMHYARKGLITEESDQHQYRFKDLADPETGETLFTLEHEVRSMRHPLFMRPLINRNPSQSNLNYAMGYDAWIPGMPPQD